MSNILDASFVGEKMSVQGAINKTFILFAIMMLTATISFAIPKHGCQISPY